MEYSEGRILCLGKNIAFTIYEITLYKSFDKGILLNLGSIYAQEKGNYIRLSYAYASLEDLQKGIYELGLMIKELASR